MPQRGTIPRERCKRSRQSGGDTRLAKATSSRAEIITTEDDCHRDDTDESQVSSQFPSAASEAVTSDIQSDIKKRFDECQLIERDVASLLKQRKQSTAAMGSILSVKNLSPNDVIRLNVGDELFTVPIQLLLGKDGDENFFDVILGFYNYNNKNDNLDDDNNICNYFFPPPLDETGALFIDRDPSTFRHILNYLRGYQLLGVLNEDQLSMLRTDARYFRIGSLINELGDQTATNMVRFRPGPGVNPERNRFRVIYGIAMVGERFLITGRHSITFQVMNSDYVGIGLVSDSCVSTDQEFHKTPNCCVYYMTGVFYSNFPHHRKEDGLEALERGDYVSLMVDMNKRVAEYTLKGSTKMISLGNARKLRFAVAMKLSSSVRIVPEEEARKLSLFQRGPLMEGLSSETHMPLFGDHREQLTQLSQPSGAGSLASGGTQEQTSLQRPHDVSRSFISPSLNNVARPSFIDGVGRTARTVVLGSFTGGLLPNDMSEMDPILFISGNREAM